VKSRIIKEYSPSTGPSGVSTAKALRYWSDRATANSDQSKRARGGDMRLPDTGGAIKLHSTSDAPRGKR
jgi:hypothetical protein